MLHRLTAHALSKGLLAVVFLLSAGAMAMAQTVEISRQEIGNVSPFSFSVVWQVSETSTPAVEIYSDSEGTVDVSGQVAVEYYPLHLGDRTVSSDYLGRMDRLALQARLRERNLVLVRFTQLEPATTYYVRPKALDGSGTDLTSNGPLPLLEVTTALENAFVEESRQLVLDFSTPDPDASNGAVARIVSPGLLYPLFSVIGDGSQVGEAFFNLDNLLDAAGLTNLNPSEPLNLEINLMGAGVLDGFMQYEVPYGGGFVAAEAVVTPFAIVADSFQFDPIADQVTDKVFTITIRALDFKGNLVQNFSGTVDLTSSLAMSSGGGVSPAFSAGVLADHNVILSEPGQGQLTATETGGDASGTSNIFQVIEIKWNLLTSVLPINGGAVTGAGIYKDGTNAAIEALPAPNFLFLEWDGTGIDDPSAASTFVTMTSDHEVTAYFVDDPSVIDYAEWVPLAFAEFANDPIATAPDFDLDLDGLSNRFEYAVGTDPLSKDRDLGVPSIGLNGQGMATFTYHRRVNAVGATFSLQTTPDFVAGWSPFVPDPANVTVEMISNSVERVTVVFPMSPDKPPYIRFVITFTEL
ncbi:MAG TPA: hypothetical protein VK995_03780 [Oceanipulchritudo sp.]|nr:hypothetical protein [Oceanipulchritudo sp.]